MSAISIASRKRPSPLAVAAFVGVGLCVAVGLSERGALHLGDRPGATVVARSLVVDESSLGLDVRQSGGALVEHLPSDTDSFVRGVFHSLILLRRSHGVAVTEPYQLAELADGSVMLSDPATGTRIDLEGFGPANRAAFLALLGLTVPSHDT